MSMYKVSVIIVTYNRLDYLQLTIDSILKQTYQNTEIVIVGDGNQDDVEDYVLKLQDNRILYSYVQHCGYPAKGRNHGISISNGSYIAFCDDDDLWAPSKLEKQIAILEADTHIDLCFTNRVIIDSDGCEGNKNSLLWIPKNQSVNNLLMTNYISYSSVVIRRKILLKAGLFIDDIKFRAVEDYHLWLRIAFHGKVWFLNESLIYYRVHSSNITSKLSVGARKNITLFKDLFSKYKFSFFDKMKAYFTAYSKLTIYLLRNK